MAAARVARPSIQYLRRGTAAPPAANRRCHPAAPLPCSLVLAPPDAARPRVCARAPRPSPALKSGAAALQHLAGVSQQPLGVEPQRDGGGVATCTAAALPALRQLHRPARAPPACGAALRSWASAAALRRQGPRRRWLRRRCASSGRWAAHAHASLAQTARSHRGAAPRAGRRSAHLESRSVLSGVVPGPLCPGPGVSCPLHVPGRLSGLQTIPEVKLLCRRTSLCRQTGPRALSDGREIGMGSFGWEGSSCDAQ
jgi:hypothetical protein